MVQFDPSWVSKTEKQHLVPNTYLKAWSTNNDYVYYIDKNEKTVEFTQVDFQKRTKQLTIIKEFYSRNINSYFFEKGDLEEIFKPLTAKNYSVKFKGEDIAKLTELRSVFDEFNKWVIRDSRQMLILEEDKQLLKKKLKIFKYEILKRVGIECLKMLGRLLVMPFFKQFKQILV
ncbi:DUF4238 domain-containing protein [Bacillus sp. OVS6]|nr:DUF4238 domain-containing protein [Bacillus sp. OVS6]